MALLKPTMAVLDETDSGLDIDALRTVAEGVNRFAGPDMGVLIITHYQRILHLVEPDRVHVMYEGRIVKEGGPELVTELEEQGLRLDQGGGRGERLSAAATGSRWHPSPPTAAGAAGVRRRSTSGGSASRSRR